MALAEEWLLRGGLCAWATTDGRSLKAAGTGSDDIQSFVIDAVPGSAGDALATRNLAEKLKPHWVAVDLPTFHRDYFTGAGSRGSSWLVIHDGPLPPSDRIQAILNPCPNATPALYPGRGGVCNLLLGPEFALLRSEFRADASVAPSVIKRDSRPLVLVTFGGSDPADLTWRLLSILRQSGVKTGARWRVVLGPGYRGRCAASGCALRDDDVEFVRYTSDMARHLRAADLVICGAGNTLWEAMHLGLPTVVMPAVLSQRTTYEAAENCPSVKRFEEPDAEFMQWLEQCLAQPQTFQEWRREAARMGPGLIDGLGVVRTVDCMLSETR